jgi:hypothetical protein
MQGYKKANPHLHQVFNINFTSDRYDSGIKNDGGWNEMLDRIAEKNPEGDLEGRRKKSAKEIKTRAAIEKNRKKLGITYQRTDTSAGIAKHGHRTD